MRFDPPLEAATLISRYKRFLADIALEGGRKLTVHCPNTGSMRNCNLPDSGVLFSDSGNDKRKYRHTLEAVTTPSGAWAGINTSRANHLVREGIENGRIKELQGYRLLRSEVPYGKEKSRIDFLLEGHTQLADCYVEVKNVTLEVSEQHVQFPDAVTERGTKHLRELIQVVKDGKRAVLCFCVQHSTAKRFSPAEEIDSLYAATLKEAIEAGVEVIAYAAAISADEIVLKRKVRCSY